MIDVVGEELERSDVKVIRRFRPDRSYVFNGALSALFSTFFVVFGILLLTIYSRDAKPDGTTVVGSFLVLLFLAIGVGFGLFARVALLSVVLTSESLIVPRLLSSTKVPVASITGIGLLIGRGSRWVAYVWQSDGTFTCLPTLQCHPPYLKQWDARDPDPRPPTRGHPFGDEARVRERAPATTFSGKSLQGLAREIGSIQGPEGAMTRLGENGIPELPGRFKTIRTVWLPTESEGSIVSLR